MDPETIEKERKPVNYGYFVMHALAVVQDGRTEVRTTLENLQTGEKRTFGTPTELGRFLMEWGSGSGVPIRGGDARFRGPRESGQSL